MSQNEPNSDWPRVIVHADMDAFYAQVEQLDHPELRGKPVLVGPNSDRGVVLTASYEARPFKVGSAMPVALARRRCPQGIFVPPRFERYKALSQKIMAVFADFSPSVEAISLDEAFLDMSGAEELFGAPRDIAASIQRKVADATGGLTVSVGVSATKYVAKVASGHKKPNGVTIVPGGSAREWLAPQDVSRLWGAGPKTQEKLRAFGYLTIGDVAGADPKHLRSQLGSAGEHFYELAHGRDVRRVARRRRAKSLSSDRTLAEDVSDPQVVKRHLQRSADRVAKRLRAKGYVARGVRIKLKTSGFQLLTRQARVPPTDLAATLYSAAERLYDKLDHEGPFRLVGLGGYDLEQTASSEAPEQLGLFEPRRSKALEHVIDSVNQRFGDGSVHRARDVGSSTIIDHGVNLDFVDSDDEVDVD